MPRELVVKQALEEHPEDEAPNSDESLAEVMPQVFVLRVTANGRLFR